MILSGLITFSGNLSKNIEYKLAENFKNFYHREPSMHSSENISLVYYKDLTDATITTHQSFFIGRAISKSSFKPLQQQGILDFEKNSNNFYDNYWGGYVLITCENKNYKILIDPSGQTEIYYGQLSNGDLIFATDIVLIENILHIKPSLNNQYLSAILLYADYEPTGTVYSEIKKIPIGCQLYIQSGSLEVKIGWEPQKYERMELNSKIEFSELMQAVLKSWIEPYDEIYLNFSGGLDSTSILFCLLADPSLTKNKKFVAINYYTSWLKSSNELNHVKSISNELNFVLETHELGNYDFFIKPKTFEYKLNNPTPNLMFWNNIENIYNLSGINENSLLINGYGGDHVFMQAPPITSVIDAFVQEDIKTAMHALQELCIIYRSNFYDLLKKNMPAIWRYYTGTKKYKYFSDKAVWVTEQLLSHSKDFIPNPIFDNLNILPGKHEHLDSIYRGLGSLQPPHSKQYEKNFSPFLSQPILEWALSIPSYKLFAEKVDRYPVRKSINKTFNTNSVWRVDKGSTTGHNLRGIKKNLHSIRDICLNGCYVKNDLVDKQLLQDNISRLACGDTDNLWPFMRLYCAELFFVQYRN